MGKSSKKIKNDRINAIRKQYDAFLEEDKKRKERNEYILGKLDIMRSTTLVPITTSVRRDLELNSPGIYLNSKNERTTPEVGNSYITNLHRQNMSLTINKHPDELSILKEISKKYILIPKRRTAIENDYINVKAVIDDDWRSKYNILDDLKRLEKEGQSDPVLNQDNNNMYTKTYEVNKNTNMWDKQPPSLDKDSSHFDKPISDKNNELTTLNKSLEVDVKENNNINGDVPENSNQESDGKEASLQIASVSSNADRTADQTKSLPNAAQEVVSSQQDLSEKEKYNAEITEKDVNLTQSSSNNLEIPEIKNDVEKINYQKGHYQLDVHNILPVESNKRIAPENVKADTGSAEMSEQIISRDVKQESYEIHTEETTNRNSKNYQNLASSEIVEACNDKDNNPDVINTHEINFDTHYPEQTTTPVILENTQHLDQVEQESEINAFEVEQKEMFYSEQTGGDTYTYNQGDANAGEYTEGYEQNDQYAYYEGVQQEQAYATDINEHEESTERYDPHYNEQYDGSYENQHQNNPVEYENTDSFQQQQFQAENPHMENTANYDNEQENSNLYQQENVAAVVSENVSPPVDQQIYDQHLYDEQQETQENIEQQLITEEGYTESTPVIADVFQQEDDGETEKVINLTTEEPMPDPKLS